MRAELESKNGVPKVVPVYDQAGPACNGDQGRDEESWDGRRVLEQNELEHAEELCGLLPELAATWPAWKYSPRLSKETILARAP